MRSYSAMLPRIKANEQLDAIEAAGIAFGRLQPKDEARRLRELERVANGGRRRQPRAKATPEQLAAMGIGVRMAEA